MLLQGIELASQGVVFTLAELLLHFGELLVEQGAAGLDLEGLAGEGVTGGDELGVILHGGGRCLHDRRRGGFFATGEDEGQNDGGEQRGSVHGGTVTRH